MARTPLDVLVIESQSGIGDDAAAWLEEAGHHVHRCTDAGDADFPCREIQHPGSCALHAHVDAAVVCRDAVPADPTYREVGVNCAIRAGVPIVADGPTLLDPFGPWVDERVRHDPAEIERACFRVRASSDRDIRDQVLHRIGVILQTIGANPSSVRCEVDHRGSDLTITVDVGRPVSASVRQAIGVRVLDALRVLPETFGTVDVKVAPMEDLRL